MKAVASTLALIVLPLLPLPALLAAEKPGNPAPVQKPATPAKSAPPPVVNPAEPAEIKDPVAVVDGVEIKKADVEGMLTGILAQQGKSIADIPAAQRAQIYRTVLDDLIVERIVARRAAEVQVTDEEVASVLGKFKANFGSEEELKSQLGKMGQTLEGVQQKIRTTLQAQHWVDEQLKGKTEVPETDADEFYKENPDQFQMTERVRASHILIRVPEEAKPDEVVAKQKAAQQVLARIKKGESFEKVADEVSEDPSAKQNHGDLDFFEKKQMVPEFAEAAFKLKPGDLGPEPVRTEFGYHIIKVTDRKEPERIPLEKAKPQLLAFLKQKKRDFELQKLAKDLRDGADVQINLPGATLPAQSAAPPAASPPPQTRAEAVTPPVSAPAAPSPAEAVTPPVSRPAASPSRAGKPAVPRRPPPTPARK
jgi:peptidyl-prolyl cis-trans isomerase C